MAWKEKVATVWDSIEIVSYSNATEVQTEAGSKNSLEVVVDVKDASLVDSFGVELVSTVNEDGADKFFSARELNLTKKEGTKLTFSLDLVVKNAGAYKSAFRLYPKSADLPHRQDFCFVRWF